MNRLGALVIIAVSLVACSNVFASETRTFERAYASGLTGLESQIISLVNGTSAYDYDLELEQLTLNHSVSEYSFRSAGSSGANVTAEWITRKFESFGLETYNESYSFTNWNVIAEPILIIDDDGSFNTTTDEVQIASFQPVHYSWPTPLGGAYGDLVVLPLPPAANASQVGVNPINLTEWNAINTTGKILLVGREVRMSRAWEKAFKDKLTAEPPAAIVYTWWYDWMSWVPPVFFSADGVPGRTFGSYLWNLEIPAGFVDYADGLWIRNREASQNVSASTEINAVIETGNQFNIIGKLRGSVFPDKFVILCGHRDTVVDAGFCDNGAGASGVIELARVFSEANRTGLMRPKYTLLFILFDGEELGYVGSTNYVMQHKSELDNIVAIFNMDVPGSDNLDYTDSIPDPATGIHLDQIVSKATEDLNISATFDEEVFGGSDDIPFIDPPSAEFIYSYFWNISAGIEDANPVESSLTISSYPTYYIEQWSEGTPGWMHTSYDNSSTTDWVEIADLQDQLRVAALSMMRVQNAGMHWESVFREPSGDATEGEAVQVYANVTENENGMKNVTLSYSVDNGTSWTDVLMNQTGTPSLWNGTIPSQSNGTLVTFRLLAYDNVDNLAVNEGGSVLYVYNLIPEVPLFPVLTSFMIATLWAIVMHRKKYISSPREE